LWSKNSSQQYKNPYLDKNPKNGLPLNNSLIINSINIEKKNIHLLPQAPKPPSANRNQLINNCQWKVNYKLPPQPIHHKKNSLAEKINLPIELKNKS
jgi:hypothetical protein